MIIVTPNPAIDRTLVFNRLVPGEIHRARHTLVAAGGKGLNAARSVQTLGGAALCMGFLGGYSGRLLGKLAKNEGLSGAWTWTGIETRTCIILVDDSGEPTVINEPGFEIPSRSWELLAADIARQNQYGGTVAFCGSLPAAADPAIFTHLIRQLSSIGREVWVDSSGPALLAALDAVPSGIKVNLAEAAQVLGHTPEGKHTALTIAHELLGRGIGCVALTLGQEGAIVADVHGAWYATPPPVKAVSNVGSGDAFLGSFLLALEQHQGINQALRRGVAAGAANTLRPGGGRFDLADYTNILENTQLVQQRRRIN